MEVAQITNTLWAMKVGSSGATTSLAHQGGRLGALSRPYSPGPQQMGSGLAGPREVPLFICRFVAVRGMQSATPTAGHSSCPSCAL